MDVSGGDMVNLDGNTGKPQGFEPREARFMLIEIRRHRVAQPTVGIAGMRNQW
jgi:hypothetical protein